jgi:hypothetical protein
MMVGRHYLGMGEDVAGAVEGLQTGKWKRRQRRWAALEDLSTGSKIPLIAGVGLVTSAQSPDMDACLPEFLISDATECFLRESSRTNTRFRK